MLVWHSSKDFHFSGNSTLVHAVDATLVHAADATLVISSEVEKSD